MASELNFSLDTESALPCSAGVISQKLPAKEFSRDVVPFATESMNSNSVLGAAEAIIITDWFLQSQI